MLDIWNEQNAIPTDEKNQIDSEVAEIERKIEEHKENKRNLVERINQKKIEIAKKKKELE